MSRRRSQSQKENRERAVNTRRQLDKLPEMEISTLDASIAVNNMSTIQEKTVNNAKSAKNQAVEERLKQLERWKERKALEKEKETREKQRKGVFKTGLFHPKDTSNIVPLPPVPAASTRAKEPLKTQDPNTAAKRATVNIDHPAEPKEPELKEAEEKPLSPTPCSEDEDMVMDQAPADTAPAVDPVEAPSSLSSFAPEGFVFQAPVGLFKFEPLTPRSADAFLTPSSSFSLPLPLEFNAEPSEPSPPKSPHRSPPHPSPSAAPPTPGSTLESEHDVPYFRSEIASETDRLVSLCALWESKVEDESIPEEMRDRMRTAIGQARLLMKERFNQFSGLVDDCELRRGEKITTCTDLQGFWDMVYYQVEDVIKKFDALKEAEARGWAEEHKPQPRQRKVVKKPAAVPAPSKPTGTKAAAKSRLAAVKAAMKAKQQAAEAEKAAANTEDDPGLSSQEPQPQAEAQTTGTVVFDGGFFQVESPAKPSASVRRSTRLSAAVLPQASPCSSYLSPRRVTRRSLALAQTPVQTRASPAHLPLAFDQTPRRASKSQRGTPQPPQSRKDTVNVSLCSSPVKEASSDNNQPEENPALSTQDNTTPSNTPVAVRLLPSISVVHEQDEPAEVVNANTPHSPRLSLSPCKSPPAVSETPEPSSALSFTLSPCQPPHSLPTVLSSPAVETQGSMCHTPESLVLKETPGFDFDRYLQSSQRCSLSPREAVTIEMLSPMAEDVIMESPRGQSEDLLTREEAGSDSRVCPVSLHPGPEGPDTPVCLPK
ncbi:hypothetical protein PAMP_010536 [Pampus punctatissimus]